MNRLSRVLVGLCLVSLFVVFSSASSRRANVKASPAPQYSKTAQEPECRMGSDGQQVCGYNCRMGADGRVACANTPDGKCAMSSNGRMVCSQVAAQPAGADAPSPECHMGSNGQQTCGYNCRYGSNGRWYCASTPNGKCAMNSDGSWSCS